MNNLWWPNWSPYLSLNLENIIHIVCTSLHGRIYHSLKKLICSLTSIWTLRKETYRFHLLGIFSFVYSSLFYLPMCSHLMILASLYLQQIYMYFRGSGKAAELKHEAARGALRAAMWFTYTSLVAKRLNRIYDGISTKVIALMLSLFLLSLNYLTVDVWMSQCSSVWGCYLKLLGSRASHFCFVLLCYRATFVIVGDRMSSCVCYSFIY